MEINNGLREGSVEIWSDGMLEYWNIGIRTDASIILLFQFSWRKQ